MDKKRRLKSEDYTWAEYYDITRSRPPQPLLVEALKYVRQKNKAIDIGGGALKDTRFLLSQGFDTTVIDKEPLLLKEAESIKSAKLHCYVTAYDKFDYGIEQYDIAAAIYALPFNPPETFNEVFEKIKKSLVSNGIFCGQFFGIRDDWSKNNKMTFHSKEQVEKLLSGMEIIKLDEEEKERTTANGTPKHWHLFHVIAGKQ